MDRFVTFKMALPASDFEFLREVADKAEVAIVDVVKELIRQAAAGKVKEDEHVSR